MSRPATTTVGGPPPVAPALAVQHIPAGHPYVAAITDPRVLALPDPPPPGAPPGQWWPHPALEPSWVRSQDRPGVGGARLVHLHFGYEHRSPAELATWVEALRAAGIGLVVTVHDLENPHLDDPTHQLARLDVVVPAARAVITLTAGAARVIRSRWGVQAHVLAHPHVVDEAHLAAPRVPTGSFVVGVHYKSLRASVDVDVLLQEIAPAVAGLPGAVLRLHVHEDVLAPDHPRHDPRLAALAGRTPAGIDLRLHPALSDAQLWADLLEVDLAVLPYRRGTHSGWLEMCHDLGTTVLAPRIGHLREQRPIRTWEPGVPGSAAQAVRDAHRDHLAGVRPERPGVTRRRRERKQIADAHARLYEAVLAADDPTTTGGET